MKQTALFAALALAALNAFAATTPSQTVESFHAAMAAGDQKTVLALLSPDVVIYESGHVERSRDEYAKSHLPSDMAFGKATARKVTRHIEHAEGNSATVLQETTTNGSFKGKPVKSVGLETAVLEKSGDGWVIVHLHWSSHNAK